MNVQPQASNAAEHDRRSFDGSPLGTGSGTVDSLFEECATIRKGIIQIKMQNAKTIR
jgi:hypothetical protein